MKKAKLFDGEENFLSKMLKDEDNQDTRFVRYEDEEWEVFYREITEQEELDRLNLENYVDKLKNWKKLTKSQVDDMRLTVTSLLEVFVPVPEGIKNLLINIK